MDSMVMMEFLAEMDFGELGRLVGEGIQMPLSYLTDPNKRIFYLYSISSVFLAYYVYWKAKTEFSFLTYLFNKRTWLSKSAWVDYGLVFFNGLIKFFLIAPFLILGLYLSIYVNDFLIDIFSYPTFSFSQSQSLVLFTVTISIVGDFATYVVHWSMHKIPVLWQFHKVHHSATSLNPITQYRIHPIELILNNIKGILVFGVVTGVFDYLSNHQVNKLLFFGANAFSFLFMFWGANLRHSSVKLKYFNALEYIFISPYQHQIHHSNRPEHYDKNIGAKLAIWDWMFGTLVRSQSVEKIEFGLGEEEDEKFGGFWQNLIQPFVGIIQILKNKF